MTSPAPRVLFVCLGNICRSPAAEAVMAAVAAESGVSIAVDSCGTADYHVGNRADRRMRQAAQRRGIEMTSVARQVTRADLRPGTFDLVVAMDRSNLQGLRSIVGPNGNTDHIKLFSDYLNFPDNSGNPWPAEVPDPYYGGEDGFEYVLDMLQAGCPQILAALLAGRDSFHSAT